MLLQQNNCFETKGFLSPICNQQMTNFGKGKNIWGRKKIDTFQSPTRELILDAWYFVDKTRKAAEQWNKSHIFLFESAALNFFFIVPFFFVPLNLCMKNIQNNLCKAFFTIWWFFLLKTFWWKILENHFKNIHRATLYVNKRAILLILDRTSRKSFRTKDLFELKKKYCTKLRGFFLRIKNTVSYKRSTWGMTLYFLV